MPSSSSPDRPRRPIPSAAVFSAVLIAACALQIAENLLPRIPLFPWLRLGLSWLVLLPFLLRYGPLPALALLISRNMLTLVYGGQLFSTFAIGTLAGATNLLLVGVPIVYLVSRRRLGWVGAGVLLAAGFNLSQLLWVEYLFIRHVGFLFQLGPMLLWSVAAGSLIGWLAHRLHQGWESWLEAAEAASPESNHTPQPVPGKGFASQIKLITATGLIAAHLLVTVWEAQALLASVGLLLAGLKSWRLLGRAWPFFLYLAYFHLLQTGGHLLPGGWITREGLERFAFFAMRLTGVLLAGQTLAGAIPLHQLARHKHYALQGLARAIPLMPHIFPFGLELGRSLWRAWREKKLDQFWPQSQKKFPSLPSKTG